ncbi:MAG: inorganic phosphate transporter, partial [Clostridia bacterium]|nr:inorganic phosphate transporter [Clostridia bacterium]
GGFVLSLIIRQNINRLSVLFMPMVYFLGVGLHYLATHLREGFAVAAASIAAGWLGGAAAEKLLAKIKINEKYYSKVQIALAGISAVLHGAQDGQKFMCVLAFCLFSAQTEKLPFPVVLWSSAFMALGTALCGKRMLGLAENLGISDRRSGLASDLGGAAVLLLSTLLGLPVSTTHVKTASAAGAGKKRKEKKETVLRLCFAWALTFPACAFLAKGLIFLSELFFNLA